MHIPDTDSRWSRLVAWRPVRMSASAAGQKTRITAVFLVAVDTVSTVALQFKNKQTEAKTPFLFAIDAVFTVALHFFFSPLNL